MDVRGKFRLRTSGALFVAASVLLGCSASQRGAPDRLGYVEQELATLNLALMEDSAQRYVSRDEDARVSYRNELVAARMYAIDVRYTEFESSLLRERQNVGFLATTAGLALTTAGPLTGSVRAKDYLMGGASVINGGRAAFNEEVLLKLTIQAIVNQMRATRDDVKSKVLRKMDQPTSQYPLAHALADVEEYYRAGTLVSGIVEATETVGAEAERAETEKEAVEVAELARDHSAEAIRTYLYSGGRSIDSARLKRLQSLLTERGIDPNSFWELWPISRYPHHSAQREQLVRDARAAGLPI